MKTKIKFRVYLLPALLVLAFAASACSSLTSDPQEMNQSEEVTIDQNDEEGLESFVLSDPVETVAEEESNRELSPQEIEGLLFMREEKN